MSYARVSSGQFNCDKCRYAGQRLVSGWSEVTDWTFNDSDCVLAVGRLVSFGSWLRR